MLPHHEELVRALAGRTTIEIQRAARDRGFRRDVSERRREAVTPERRALASDADCRPCPPTSTERARSVAR